MKTVRWALVAVGLTALGCGNPARDVHLASNDRARSVALTSAVSSADSAVASAVELYQVPKPRQARTSPAPAPHRIPAVRHGEPVAAPPVAESPTAEPVPVAEKTPAVAHAPAPSPAPEPAAPVSYKPVSAGDVATLEPGQTVTVLANPMAGASAQPEMPAPTEEIGIGMDDGSCPRGGVGGRHGGGSGGVPPLIGILR